MKGITSEQRRFLWIIEEFIEKHGFPPTVRELRALIDVRSTFAVSCRLLGLQKKGYIRIDIMKARGITIVKRTFVFVAPERNAFGDVYFPACAWIQRRNAV